MLIFYLTNYVVKKLKYYVQFFVNNKNQILKKMNNKRKCHYKNINVNQDVQNFFQKITLTKNKKATIPSDKITQ